MGVLKRDYGYIAYKVPVITYGVQDIDNSKYNGGDRTKVIDDFFNIHIDSDGYIKGTEKKEFYLFVRTAAFLVRENNKNVSIDKYKDQSIETINYSLIKEQQYYNSTIDARFNNSSNNPKIASHAFEKDSNLWGSYHNYLTARAGYTRYKVVLKPQQKSLMDRSYSIPIIAYVQISNDVGTGENIKLTNYIYYTAHINIIIDADEEPAIVPSVNTWYYDYTSVPCTKENLNGFEIVTSPTSREGKVCDITKTLIVKHFTSLDASREGRNYTFSFEDIDTVLPIWYKKQVEKARYWIDDFKSLLNYINPKGTSLESPTFKIYSILLLSKQIIPTGLNGYSLEKYITKLKDNIWENKDLANSQDLKPGELYFIIDEYSKIKEYITLSITHTSSLLVKRILGYFTYTYPEQFINILLLPNNNFDVTNLQKITLRIFEKGEKEKEDLELFEQTITFFNKDNYPNINKSDLYNIEEVEEYIEEQIEDDNLNYIEVLDTNEGEMYSGTSLLFKNNHANIYQSIENKDNTLFLGNYKNINQELTLYETFQNALPTIYEEKYYTAIPIDMNILYGSGLEKFNINIEGEYNMYGIGILPVFQGNHEDWSIFNDTFFSIKDKNLLNFLCSEQGFEKAGYNFKFNYSNSDISKEIVENSIIFKYKYKDTEVKQLSLNNQIKGPASIEITFDYMPEILKYVVYLFIQKGDGDYVINSMSHSQKIETEQILKETSLSINTKYKKIPLTVNTDDSYNYLPNLKLSSQDKKLFKAGEHYILGMVFVYEDGTRSNIYFLPSTENQIQGFSEWVPNVEPYIYKKEDNYYFNKEVMVLTIKNSLSNFLKNNLKIIGIIPVYFPRMYHRILCQGFLNPTLKNSAIEKSLNINSFYDWFYRDALYPNNYVFSNHKNTEILTENSEGSLSSVEAPDFGHNFNIEIQSQDGEYSQNSTNQTDQGNATSTENTAMPGLKCDNHIFTFNSPEFEMSDAIVTASLAGHQYRDIAVYDNLYYTNNVEIAYNAANRASYVDKDNVYKGYIAYERQYEDAIHSELGLISLSEIVHHKFKSGFLWFGYALNENDKTEEDAIKHATNITRTGILGNYAYFKVYPWQRNRLGTEVGDEYTIKTKRYFSQTFSDSISKDSSIYSTIKLQDYIVSRNDDSFLYKINYNKENNQQLLYQSSSNMILPSMYNKQPLTYNIQAVSAFDFYDKTNSIKNNKKPITVGQEGNPPTSNTIFGITSDINATEGECIDAISVKYKAAPHAVLAFEYPYCRSVEHTGITVGELYNPNLLQPINEDVLIQGAWIPCGKLTKLEEDKDTNVVFEEGDFFFGRFDSLRTQPYTQDDVNQVTEIVSAMLCSRVNLDARTDSNRGVKTPTVTSENFNLVNEVYNQPNNYFTYQYQNILDFTYNRNYTNTMQWSLPKIAGEVIDTWCNVQDSNFLDLDGDKGALISFKRLGNNIIAFQEMGISVIQYNEKTQVSTNQGIPVEIANSGKVEGKYYITNNIGCQSAKAIASSPSGLYFIDSINKGIYFLDEKLQLQNLSVLGLSAWSKANLNKDWWVYYDSIAQEILFINSIEALVFSEPSRKFIAFLSYGGIRHWFRCSDQIIQVCPSNFIMVSTTDQVKDKDIAKDYIPLLNASNNTLWKRNAIDDTKIFGQKVGQQIEWICNPTPQNDKTFTTIEYRADSFCQDGTYIPEETFSSIRVFNEYQDTTEIPLIYSQEDTSNLKKKFRIWNIDIPRAIEYDTINGVYATDNRIRNMWCKITLTHNNSESTKGYWKQLSKSMEISKEDLSDVYGDVTIVAQLPESSEEGDMVILCDPSEYDDFIINEKDTLNILGIYSYHTNAKFIFYDVKVNYLP